MQTARHLQSALAICLIVYCSGCSSLGLSCFPTGHYLTDQAEAVLDRASRTADIPRELDMDVMPAHYLQPGDVLLLEPVDLESDVRIPADQKVLIDGSVDLGKYGRVVVAGLTLEDAERLIEDAIVDTGEKPSQINLRLLDPVQRYYVLGEVNSPGSYPLEGQESVLDGILAAGGLTTAAAPCKVLLARPSLPSSCRVTLPVCYREITQLGDTTTNYQLRPGDRIFVATRTFCEDLMFWQATRTCGRCCKCQTACLNPNLERPINPMARVAARDVSRNELPFRPRPARGINGPGAGATSEAVPLSPSIHKTGQGQLEWAEETSRDQPDSAPQRLPQPVDGELDFGPRTKSKSLERFEPLWLSPARQ